MAVLRLGYGAADAFAGCGEVTQDLKKVGGRGGEQTRLAPLPHVFGPDQVRGEGLVEIPTSPTPGLTGGRVVSNTAGKKLRWG